MAKIVEIYNEEGIPHKDIENNTEDENPDIQRLKAVHRQMIMLIDEAEYLVRKMTGNGIIFDRAKAYWIPHIKTALSNDTEYLGKSMVTMEDTISEIEKKENKEDKDNEDLDEDLD